MDVEITSREAAGQVVALLVAARGVMAESDLHTLDRMGAFARLGIDREDFLALVQRCSHDICDHLGETSWLRNDDRQYADRLLGAVGDAAERDLVCRLAAAVMDSGFVPHEARMLYAHILATWRVAAPLRG